MGTNTAKKSKASKPKLRLLLELHPLAGFRRKGQAIRSIRPFAAGLKTSSSTITVGIGLPDLSRAELRWGVDKVLRSVSTLWDIGPVTIRAAESIDSDTVLTLALDRHHASGGQVTVEERPEISAALATIGASEDGYRAWVNEDPTSRTSLAIARDVASWCGEREDVVVETLDEKALRKKGLNLLLAVGGASRISPPRLVIASYTPDGHDSKDALMLLGKGITFDTGGINVKPYESFVSMMKNDMAGAALAWWLFRGLVEGGYDRPLIVVLATCENPVGEEAMRPGSIFKSYRGHKVRVDHTDAEGRLALADGLAYAADRYSPARVISFATLTTSALISYGPYATPVHFAPPELETRWRAAATATGEDLHFFEQRLWHFEANRDREADLKNTARLPGNASRGAGSRNAAHFLKHFTDVPLVHLDIFASTWNWAGDAPGAGYGATGAPMRTLLRALLPAA